ncbi:MAG: aldose epimerase family protein [Bacteroidota bacterium]|nr:aldose epimerase family protein [Bacteroidota bacterium]
MLFSKKISVVALGIILSLILYSCDNNENSKDEIQKPISSSSASYLMDKSGFQTTVDSQKTDLYILRNNKGAIATFTNYGGRIVSLQVPDKNDSLVNVVCGFKSVEDYQKSTEPYFGATIGRFGNRIAKGKFTLDGKSYSLFLNNGPNTLHGGKKGFQYQVWNAIQPDSNSVIFTRISPNMEEGFPGNLNVKVTYTLNDNNALEMEYEATTDKETILNLTNHAFFNLNGEGSGTILNHEVQIFSNTFTPVDSTLIPTGKIEPVMNTPFDFRQFATIGSRINEKNQQLINGKGYDINFVLDSSKNDSQHLAAKVIGDKSGIEMSIYTDQPGLQFYSGNFMFGKNTFNDGSKDEPRTAFAMETQHFPDSPNEISFPNTVLKPGETYHSKSTYVFSVKKD